MSNKCKFVFLSLYFTFVFPIIWIHILQEKTWSLTDEKDRINTFLNDILATKLCSQFNWDQNIPRRSSSDQSSVFKFRVKEKKIWFIACRSLLVNWVVYISEWIWLLNLPYHDFEHLESHSSSLQNWSDGEDTIKPTLKLFVYPFIDRPTDRANFTIRKPMILTNDTLKMALRAI